MADRVRVREIDDVEGPRLLRIVRRGSGSVVTWRQAQMVLLSAQGMPKPIHAGHELSKGPTPIGLDEGYSFGMPSTESAKNCRQMHVTNRSR